MLAVVPRICLTVFNFTQPSLLEVTVKYIGQAEPDASHGKGLIGAWALVFLGLAVSTPSPKTHCREIASSYYYRLPTPSINTKCHGS